MTLREIHERCKTRHSNQMSRRGGHPLSVVCSCCGSSWPCPDYADAVAALQALDEAEREVLPRGEASNPGATRWYGDNRLVPDPEVRDA